MANLGVFLGNRHAERESLGCLRCCVHGCIIIDQDVLIPRVILIEYVHGRMSLSNDLVTGKVTIFVLSWTHHHLCALLSTWGLKPLKFGLEKVHLYAPNLIGYKGKGREGKGRGMLHTSTTNKHFSFSTTTIHIDDHLQPQPTTPPSATTAVRRSEPPSHTLTTTTTWQRHVSSPTADGDLACQRTCHVVQTVTTQSSSLPTLVQTCQQQQQRGDATSPAKWMTGDGDDLACQRAPNTMKSDDCPAPPLEPRCYVAVSNVATKRRTTANSLFVVVIHLMTHRMGLLEYKKKASQDTMGKKLQVKLCRAVTVGGKEVWLADLVRIIFCSCKQEVERLGKAKTHEAFQVNVLYVKGSPLVVMYMYEKFQDAWKAEGYTMAKADFMT
ncbi:uncharacterized protein LACBIDRAFT_331665 [Laccaria bicolor S238N-H82]|uniref:Predicted protein n=1 Tax=Laccaria bicolor (strain S238N-H82 / ATCC MYA-4686) TaxID=486041 RepID=B0DQ63_LACBS|nr:uncharacterized protein LACBIDRAFT_331665 [Laccaria bicolor S238N-H82]EDR03238.1 predicted protein [Laccaria bicolor S238N-H82]|eukprot:XP_001886034.1 predicted protein [Laccaria bicolor S238N-H82]